MAKKPQAGIKDISKFTYQDVIDAIKEMGFKKIKTNGGSHHKWQNPQTGDTLEAVPHKKKGSTSIGPRITKNLLVQCGWIDKHYEKLDGYDCHEKTMEFRAAKQEVISWRKLKKDFGRAMRLGLKLPQVPGNTPELAQMKSAFKKTL